MSYNEKRGIAGQPDKRQVGNSRGRHINDVARSKTVAWGNIERIELMLNDRDQVWRETCMSASVDKHIVMMMIQSLTMQIVEGQKQN